MSAMALNSAAQPIVIPPLTLEEEGTQPYFSIMNQGLTLSLDQVILARISIDERPLRRMIKKFHSYTSLSNTPIVPIVGTPASSIQDARESFLLELASFQLLMKKSAMICEAEARQVEEYQRERQRLGAFLLT